MGQTKYYEKEEEAAIAYDSAVIRYNKPLYKLNFSLVRKDNGSN